MKLTSITWFALISLIIVNQSFSYVTNKRVNFSNTIFVPSDTTKTLNKVQGNPYITNYQFSDEEQLIWSISHTKSGEMVFAHRQGITIYNGTSFTNIKLNSVPVTLQPFHESEMILVGCENEYGLLKKETTGDFQYQRLIDSNFNSGEIQEIKVTESHIYFYSNDQVFCHNSHTLKFEKMWKVSNNEAFNGIIQLADQIFINKKNKGLAKITNEENFQIIPGTKALSNQLILFSIPFNQNSTLIGTHENNLYLFDGKKLTSYSFQNQKYISDNQLVDGIWLSENQFALSTLSGGFLLIDKGKSKIETIINYQNGLPDDEIFAIERDLQGGIWISHGFGISRLNYRLPVEDFSQFPGIEGNLLDVTEFDKTIYIATTQGVFYLDSVRYRYYRAYKGSVSGTKLISRSGVAAAGNETIAAFRTKAKANGTGWGLVDWHLLFAVQTLLFIEIGTFNSQAVLGNGNDTGGDYGMTTGGSNSIGNASSPATNDDTWMSYRGIENFYADIFEWIDGVNFSERLVYTSNTQSTFASDVFSGAYTSTGVTLPSSGYISDMNFSIKGFIPTVATGSDSTYVTDYVYSSTGARVAAFGGYAGHGLACGAASLYASDDSSYTSSAFGAGLSF